MKILAVIDAQEDFFRGTLANENAVKIIPNLVDRCERAVTEGEKILFTQDTHCTEYFSTLEGKKLPVEHCQIDTTGWAIIPELQKYVSSANCIRKTTFGSLRLADAIERIASFAPVKSLEIELCGVVSSICVLANAVLLRASYPDAKITINANLIADINDENQAAAIVCFKAQQIDVIE